MLNVDQLKALSKPKAASGAQPDRLYATISKDKTDVVRKAFQPLATIWNVEVATALRIVLENIADGHIELKPVNKA